MILTKQVLVEDLSRPLQLSERLDVLADQCPLVSKALTTISGNIRQTAALLDVLVVIKMGILSGPDSAGA